LSRGMNQRGKKEALTGILKREGRKRGKEE
jgi:hypothetical protein